MNQNYIHTAQLARQIDYDTIHSIGIPSLVLMERAGLESVKIIEQHIKHNDKILVLCGPGNNGGDGIVISRLLNQKGYDCLTFIPDLEKMSADEKKQYEIARNIGLHFINNLEDAIKEIHSHSILIDCLFGNGLSRDIKGNYEQIIQEINQADGKVFSIDISSGLHATTGKVLNIAVKADVTIALDCIKQGHLINEGLIYSGKLYCVNIGIPKQSHEQDPTILLDEGIASKLLPERDEYGHKGTFKRACMIGGSQSMHGAITLAAKACYKSGIGTLTLMIPECISSIIAGKMEFAMNLIKPDLNGYFDYSQIQNFSSDINKYSIISIGNGMGQNINTIHMVKEVLETDKPVIVDADAIWALKEQRQLLKRKAVTILTPHIKEMTYLCDESISEILSHPFDTLKSFTEQYPDCIVVLKSSITIIASQKGMYVLSRPNSALAKGGSGDILCGIITGLCGQTDHYFEATTCAVWIHSLSATKDIDPACYQPDDVINEIANAFKKLRVV